MLAVSAFVLLSQNIDELWIAFGMQQRYKHIPVHEFVMELGHDKSTAMPAFHALTRCDTTSSFYGKGKNCFGSMEVAARNDHLTSTPLLSKNPSEQMIRTHT